MLGACALPRPHERTCRLLSRGLRGLQIKHRGPASVFLVCVGNACPPTHDVIQTPPSPCPPLPPAECGMATHDNCETGRSAVALHMRQATRGGPTPVDFCRPGHPGKQRQQVHVGFRPGTVCAERPGVCGPGTVCAERPGVRGPRNSFFVGNGLRDAALVVAEDFTMKIRWDAMRVWGQAWSKAFCPSTCTTRNDDSPGFWGCSAPLNGGHASSGGATGEA
jgi:hypothetical protein